MKNFLFMWSLLIWTLFCSQHSCSPSRGAEVDMTPHFDEQTPLVNPHKGWYHHFPDNHLTKKYVIADDAELLEFPGMDHLYMRLAWSYLEPREGQFDWGVIDKTIDKWTSHGLGIAFRISCKETSTDRVEQQFATPRWVMEAGAKGDYYYKGEKTGPDGPWEPVFDDSIFLAKLENFLKAFGERYDGKTWLRYVDIGSIGDWGEGHTSSGSRLHYDFDQRKPHVDLYCKYFPKTQLIISDDFVYGIRDPRQRKRMHRYVLNHGISYRDDSILVDWYVTQYMKDFTVRSPEFFADAYRTMPTVLELQHYSSVKQDGNWPVLPGSSLAKFGDGKTGPDVFRGALGVLHATYIGYHGYAGEWLSDNPALTEELLNRCGYWYFLHRVTLPEQWKPGGTSKVDMTWENRGVAPAYHAYQLTVRLDGPQTIDLSMPSGNRGWTVETRGRKFGESYKIKLPESLRPGVYQFKIKLHSREASRDVLLALDRGLRDADGFYRIAEIEVGH